MYSCHEQAENWPSMPARRDMVCADWTNKQSCQGMGNIQRSAMPYLLYLAHRKLYNLQHAKAPNSVPAQAVSQEQWFEKLAQLTCCYHDLVLVRPHPQELQVILHTARTGEIQHLNGLLEHSCYQDELVAWVVIISAGFSCHSALCSKACAGCSKESHVAKASITHTWPLYTQFRPASQDAAAIV